MNHEDRITPDMIVEAYKATGLMAIEGTFYRPSGRDEQAPGRIFREQPCACALAALAINRGLNPREIEMADDHIGLLSAFLKIGRGYARSFAEGWDLRGPDEDYEPDDEDGYADGMACRHYFDMNVTEVL